MNENQIDINNTWKHLEEKSIPLIQVDIILMRHNLKLS